MAVSIASQAFRYVLLAFCTFSTGTAVVITAAILRNEFLPKPPNTVIRMTYIEGCMYTKEQNGRITLLEIGDQRFCSRHASGVASLGAQVFHAIKSRRAVCREKYSSGSRQFVLEILGRSLDSVCGPTFDQYQFDLP